MGYWNKMLTDASQGLLYNAPPLSSGSRSTSHLLFWGYSMDIVWCILIISHQFHSFQYKAEVCSKSGSNARPWVVNDAMCRGVSFREIGGKKLTDNLSQRLHSSSCPSFLKVVIFTETGSLSWLH